MGGDGGPVRTTQPTEARADRAGAVLGTSSDIGSLASAVGNRAFGALIARRAAGAGAPRPLQRDPAPKAAAPRTKADDPDAEKKKAFSAAPHKLASYEPSIGGRFGVDYNPSGNTITITINVAFDFVDAPTGKAKRDELSMYRWSEAQKAEWRQAFCRQVAQRWSGKHTIRSVKPGWEEYSATPAVQVQPSEKNPHYTVSVFKEVQGVRAGVSKNFTADLSESNVQTESDPSANPGEAKEKEKQILEHEKARLSEALAALSGGGANPIRFPPGSYEVPVPLRSKLWEFGRALAATNPSAPRFPLLIVGGTHLDPPHLADLLARRRAEMVGTILNGTAAGYPLTVTPGGAERLVTISLGEANPEWRNDYSVAVHEVGHMLGLPDEYDDPLHKHDEEKKEKWKALAKTAGAAVPMEGEEGSTTSQMSKGTDVLPAHYVTIWEALGRVTGPDFSPTDWRLS